jgi:thioredoxin-dependent adenylylsulfate APS reductase
VAVAELSASDTIRWALETFPRERVAVCTSFQVEGMAILDMAWRIDRHIRVFTVDTGRLPQATHDMIDRVRARYGLAVEVLAPEAPDLELLTASYGSNPFYLSVASRHACCEARKLRPMARALRGLDAWITGLRRSQSSSRETVEKVAIDEQHGGIVKLSPLADWSEDDVWTYVRANDVPVHALYAEGYTSIGCAPCTRATLPGEHPRAGRWWWESDAVPKECGLHLAAARQNEGYDVRGTAA